MATAPKLDLVEQSASTSIAVIVEQTPEIVLVDDGKREQLYDHIQREVDAFEPDLTTNKGRDAIKSLAFKITRTKTAIDAAGKRLNEDARAKINVVDAARRDARDKLDALAKSVRQPLTDWEAAEEQRVASCRADIEGFQRAAVVTMEDTATTVRERGAEVWGQAIDPERFGDMLPEAQAAKETAVATLKAALARLIQEEADRAELEKLRAEAAEREERERIAAEEAARVEAAKERERREAAEAAAAEERRAAAAKAEAERIERAAAEAEERAKLAAEASANEAAAARQREHDEALAAERRRAEAAERAERERIAQAKAEAAEQAKRDKNRAHRAQVMGETKIAIMAAGQDVSEAAAVLIVKAIVAGSVPHVSLRF